MEPASPPTRVNICEASRREPGTIYFTTRPGGLPTRQPYGWVVGIAQDGTLPIERKFVGTSQDVRALPNGNILFSQSAQGLLYELNAKGDTVATWHARGKWLEKAPPAGSVELPVNHIHHTVATLPNESFLILDAERREFQNWYINASDEYAPRQHVSLVGDIIHEITRDGTLVRSHHLFDILDPYRITHGSFDKYWQKQGFPDAFDWSHVNAVRHVAEDNTLLISVRHQDCIIKIGREDGKLRWILGNHGGWKEPWSKYLLAPKGELRWQYHQHDCSPTSPSRVMCFDNGNFRAPAFSTPISDENNFSRAVEFEIDETNMLVRQVWEYGERARERIFACYQGGALRLPKTDNTFITFGGICLKDGKPYGSNVNSFGRARLIEVTPQGEVVFDLQIDDANSAEPMAYSAFRSTHVPA
jgi:arylsulfate sulfotransferase